jgi:hypothetical protein
MELTAQSLTTADIAYQYEVGNDDIIGYIDFLIQ